MPPARGRGRGRGRGKSTPSDSHPVSGPSDAAFPDIAASTPEHMHIDPSPNSSPATIPTETPAPTPARVTTQRPDEPSSSVAPAAARTKIGAKETGPAPSKFKPRAVRRTAEEREKMGREEMERKERLAKAAARDEERAARGRGRGGFAGRGRGDAMGRRDTNQKSTASGIFGIAPEEMAKTTITSMSSRGFGFDAEDYNTTEQGGRGLGRGGVGGGSGGGSGGGGGVRDNIYDVEYPLEFDEKDTGAAIDIERIGAESDDDVIITGSRVIKGGLKPIRLPRHEHKVRTAIPIDSVVKKEESDDDVIMADVVPRDAAPEEENIIIKEEPEVEAAFRESIAFNSPESKKPAKAEGIPSTGEINPPSTPSRPKVKPPTSPELSKKTKDVMKDTPAFACEEDRQEHARHLVDVSILADELGGLQSRNENDGDANMDGEVDKREGRLYLFQFPPILPKLYNPLTTDKPPLPAALQAKEDATEIKGESSRTSGAGKPKPKPAEVDAIKPEAEEVVQPKEKVDKNKRVKRDRVVEEQGYIGKMIVRESGKVELSWGGTSLVVSRGVDASFLTTGVVMDANTRGARPGVLPHDIEGKAIGMGKIMGKFVVTPDFPKMFGDEFS